MITLLSYYYTQVANGHITHCYYYTQAANGHITHCYYYTKLLMVTLRTVLLLLYPSC